MSAVIDTYNPTTMAKPLGLYCHVARAKANEYVHIAGQVALDEAAEIVGVGDFEAQMRQTYANLGAALDSAGAGFGNVSARVGLAGSRGRRAMLISGT